MANFYSLHGLGNAFDGMVAEADEGIAFLSVKRLVDNDVNVGDRSLSIPFPDDCLMIHKKFATLLENYEVKEFASDNPFGKFLLEGRMEYGDLRVTYAQFEKSMGVTVFDVSVGKTVASINFSKDFDKVKAAIEDVLKNGDEVIDDLVFKLVELKEAETNG